MSGKIDQELFTTHEHALTHQACPECGNELTMRFGKRGPFLGCSQYPNCEFIQPLHQNDGHIVKHLGKPCPECNDELVLRQGRYGMFIGCLNYPACHHIEPLEKKAEETHIACPSCHKGALTERKSRYGKMFFACDQFPTCRFAVNHKPIMGRCQLCGYGLLIEKKLASGIKLQCADRKCHAYQDAVEPEHREPAE